MTPNTTAYLTHDTACFHMAVDCAEPRMDLIQKGELWREGIELFLIPNPDAGAEFFQIGVTPNGTHEACWAGRKLDASIVRVATRMRDTGWTVELAIPFAAMKMAVPRPGVCWKICLARSRMGAFHTWPRLSGSRGYHDFDSFAELRFGRFEESSRAGAMDTHVSIGPTTATMHMDGIIEAEWQTCARIMALVRLPATADRRLKKIPTCAEIEARIAGHYKEHGHTTALSPAAIARARRLIATQPWARAVFAKVKVVADYWAARSDDDLHDLIPTGTPKANAACYSFGCPICGVGVAQNSATAIRTRFDMPNRWQCVTCNRWFGPGENIVVEVQDGIRTFAIDDDGTGWLVPEGLPGAGHTCYFVAAWRQYMLNVLLGADMAINQTLPGQRPPFGGLSALATAYAVTGDVTYAHKALIIIARIAGLHPACDGVIDVGGPCIMPHIGWTSGGAEEIVDACVHSYDIVFDRLADDKALLAFLRRKGWADLDGDGAVTPEDIRRGIAVNLFGYMYDWLLRVRLNSRVSDWPLGQCAQMVAIGRLLEAPHIVREALSGENGFFRQMLAKHLNDGRFFYYSLMYHCGKPMYHGNVLFAAEGHHDGGFFKEPLNLFDDPGLPYARSVDYAMGVMCAGRIPGLGDGYPSRQRVGPGNGDLFAPWAMLLPQLPWLVRMMADNAPVMDHGRQKARGRPPGRAGFIQTIRRFVGNANPRYTLQLLAAMPAIGKVLRRKTAYQPQCTRLFTDSGLAILRTDNDGFNQVHALLNYGIGGTGHNHHDQLALNLIAHGHELTINKGYPYTWNANAKVVEWVQNTAAQNVVRIDGVNQTIHKILDMPVEECAGALHAFADTPLAAMVEGSNEKVYPGLATMYRRAAVLVKDPEHPFVVDIFSVAGGTVHDYQFHAQSDIAGKNFAVTCDDAATLQPTAEPIRFIDRRFMYDLAVGRTGGAITARWWIGDDADTGLILHMPAGDGVRTVITGKGQAEGDDKPVPCDPHLTVRREGAASSRFAAVLFPYSGRVPRFAVTRLEPFGGRPGQDAALAMSVTLGNRCYTIIHDLDEGKESRVFLKDGRKYAFQGTLGVMLEEAGKLTTISLSNGTMLGRDREMIKAPAATIGKVAAIDLPGKSITVSGLNRDLNPGALVKWVDKPWVYRVLNIEACGRRRKLMLDTFSLLDKGRYPMIAENDRIILLNELHARRSDDGSWERNIRRRPAPVARKPCQRRKHPHRSTRHA